jgi:hypothetical protein
MKSEAQRGAMYAAKEGNSTIGIPQKVGAKFAKHDQGGKLPEHVKAAILVIHKAQGGGCAHYAHGGMLTAHSEACAEQEHTDRDQGEEREYPEVQSSFLKALRSHKR